MKSRAHFKGHPIHPILVPFPIVFFFSTLIFDLLGILFNRYDLHIIARYLNMGGIGFGLLAAVPGIIDYLHVIPPDSSGKKRGKKHGLINISTIILFSLVLYLRKDQPSFYLIIGLEVLGIFLLSIAGWMGGTLVFRNQIGVDIRYAHAGKWKEEYYKDTGKEISVARIDELRVNQMKLLHIDNKRIVICRTEKGYAAFDDHCTHRGGSLAGGSLICGTVQCPWHGSQFDVNSGNVLAGPAKEKINIYTTWVSGESVFIKLNKKNIS